VRGFVLITAVTLTAGTLAAASAGARPAFSRNVCRLVSAKQIAAIPGLSPRCTNARPSKAPGSTLYVGNWPGKAPSSPRLQVTVALYADPGVLALAKRNLRQGLPGTPRRVAGIGSAAYEASGAGTTSIHSSVGKYVVYINLSASRASRMTVEALGKSIATQL
jgi:hypothetical protein